MEQLTTSKKPRLLDAGLESLYHQCNEWLDRTAFERDEMAFLADLMKKRDLVSPDAIKIQEELARLSNGVTDKLEAAVARVRHEIDLTLQRGLSNEQVCRSAFKEAARNVQLFKKDVRAIKRSVFTLSHSASAADDNVNETVRTIRERRAVRKYKRTPLAPKLIGQIIDAGRMAPSAMNRQPWKFHVLTDKVRIREFSDQIARVAATMFPLAHGIKPSMKEDFIFHGAPVVIFLSGPKKDDWASIDIGLCAQNMMLAARSWGLDSCPVGLAKFVAKTRLYPALKVAPSDEVKLALVFGYGDESPRMHERVKNNVFECS